MWQDCVNGIFELCGGFFILLHIVKTLRQKQVRGVSLAAVPMTFGPNAFTVTLPLGVLGGDNGIVHTAAIVGNEASSTDCVPNGGYLANGYTVYLPTVLK